ncbi:hypothetical protein [Ruminiclostridium josui]|uniref:hypothetical protein n=1 Tax=Ruminiclostridium josui TaxID=1499 RepID=UPI0004651DD4|nr:hypothetical protein [Ruminiclostridium josui]
MEYLQPFDEILFSWKKCIDSGLSTKATPTGIDMNSNYLQQILNDSKEFILIFKRCIKNIRDMINDDFLFLY